ncbi:MAG: MoxR family ATPase [Clostridiales bacterium]|jgi:MoxR-like ATPase|nr:MoxR family ATPase [Clostridiales bacterium]
MAIETGFTQNVVQRIKNEISKVVIHQEMFSDLALTAMFSGGHVLIEGVPGLAKTLWVKTLAAALDVTYKRTQFTSDLMPSDILGTKIFNRESSAFELKKGPLFTNLFLADEINRTPPKTQSALLEVMEERGITIDGETHALAEPFAVFATQNPIEFEGTYPLPEALTDRFMMKLVLTYPGLPAEKKILQMYDDGSIHATPAGDRLDERPAPDDRPDECLAACPAEDIVACKTEIAAVRVDDSIFNYIVSIVETTRRMNVIAAGASPRGSIALLLCAKTRAAVNGRDYVVPDDVKELAPSILRHRVVLQPEAEMDGVKPDMVIENILTQVKVPR